MMNIPVVVAAFNRGSALKRLLSSLLTAHYVDIVKLIISIDGGGSSEVIQVAEQFEWPYGEKEIVLHSENLGLRKHVLFCGGLTKLYDGIILLEDDLFVSPSFYHYAINATEYYKDCSNLSGIALYSLRYNESASLPFYPLNDGSDVFFMQLPCSWGQLWLKKHWLEFEDWYEANGDLILQDDHSLPNNVRRWPDTSWKKYFIKYMIENDKYFVYPRCSYTTNFGDSGQHHKWTKLFQVPLVYGEKKIFDFVDCQQSMAKYDVFCEILPDSLSQLSKDFKGIEFVVDLYGAKEKHLFNKKYVLTSKPCSQYRATYGKHLLPIECNVISGIPGKELFLSRNEHVSEAVSVDIYLERQCCNADEQLFFYNIDYIHFYNLNECRRKYQEAQLRSERIDEKFRGSKLTIHEMDQKLREMDQKLCEAQMSIETIRNSYSYKIGSKVVFPLSLLKKLYRKIY
ncbi:MAG: hypothetical protein Q7U88_10595 [Desulfocapsaceae bacterium]|nr:hypothetical protein [Desulfocapsaceae bacterium]